tara:strand:+ start:668 stop:1021 length:354 start_codon:yes stop_codon:yes gene_type:complete
MKKITLSKVNDFLRSKGINHHYTMNAVKATKNLEFVLLKYDSEVRGDACAAASTKYQLIDVENSTIKNCENIAYANCRLYKMKNNLELAPWFGNNAKDGSVKELDNLFVVKIVDDKN